MKKVAGIQERMDEVSRVSTAAVARKKEIHCFKCGEKGHITRDCRVGKKERPVCWKCGGQGHTKWQCNKVVGGSNEDIKSYCSG